MPGLIAGLFGGALAGGIAGAIALSPFIYGLHISTQIRIPNNAINTTELELKVLSNASDFKIKAFLQDIVYHYKPSFTASDESRQLLSGVRFYNVLEPVDALVILSCYYHLEK